MVKKGAIDWYFYHFVNCTFLVWHHQPFSSSSHSPFFYLSNFQQVWLWSVISVFMAFLKRKVDFQKAFYLWCLLHPPPSPLAFAVVCRILLLLLLAIVLPRKSNDDTIFHLIKYIQFLFFSIITHIPYFLTFCLRWENSNYIDGATTCKSLSNTYYNLLNNYTLFRALFHMNHFLITD